MKQRQFRPLPVREKMILKSAGKFRRLGIPATGDRVVQAALLTVLEPILEADFQPCSYGFRPNRRAHDAIAEVHLFARNGYTWVFEGDIEACFDNIDHTVLMDRLRRRVADKRVLALVKAFLKAGILGEDQVTRETRTGTPQGGILSPLLTNLALTVLDEHFARTWQQTSAARVVRARRHRRGLATYRLVRYADDFVVMVNGTRAHAEALREEVAAILAEVGLRLAPDKTKIADIDEGFDLLGFRIRRDTKQGDGRRHVYTYPSKKALASITRRVKAISRQGTNQPLTEILRQLELVLRGWTTYFRHGVSNATFCYLRHYTWRRVVSWRYMLTQFPRMPSLIPSSRATWAIGRESSITRRTASPLNSGLNSRYCRDIPSPTSQIETLSGPWSGNNGAPQPLRCGSWRAAALEHRPDLTGDDVRKAASPPSPWNCTCNVTVVGRPSS